MRFWKAPRTVASTTARRTNLIEKFRFFLLQLQKQTNKQTKIAEEDAARVIFSLRVRCR